MRASQLTGILEQTALVKAGLKALIALESRTDLGNSEKIATREAPVTLGSQRLSEAQEQFNTFQAIMEISRRCAAFPIQDSCSEDEILGYNDTGTFS